MSIDLYLAPMAGYTDSAFRLLCRKEGAKKLFTEMISIDGLSRSNTKTLFYLKTLTNDTPIIAQVFGTDKDALSKSIKLLNTLDYVEGINLNCACPVKKVVKTGAGASLLKDLKTLEALLKILKNNTTKETSIKIRLGWDTVNVEKVAKLAEDCGLDYLIIHARTAKQMYTGKANWEEIIKLKENFKIKIIGNGDIKSKEDIIKYSNYCDAIMIGRAAIGNPSIFSNISVDNNKIIETIFKHISYNQKLYGLNYFINLKKHLVYYLKNINLEKSVKNTYLQKCLISKNYSDFILALNEFSNYIKNL